VGQVAITGSSRDTISVTESLSYRGLPPDTIRSISGGTLALGYRCRSADCGVSYGIVVPRSLSVQVVTSTGSVMLSGLSGPVSATTGVGFVHGQNLSGRLAEFSTGTGSIEAAFLAAPARLTARCGTGSVTLSVPTGPSYAVTASAGLGPVTVSVRQDASAAHRIEARTDVGSVAITTG
jgi:hypothetical protein